MTWRRIFAPLQGEAEDAGVLATAARLADDFKAHLDVVLFRPDPKSYAPPIGLGKLADEMRASLARSAEDAWDETESMLRAQFEAAAKHEGLEITDSPHGPGASSARFTALTPSDIESAGLRYACACDVIVSDLPDKQESRRASSFVERLLIKSGRPVLSVPQKGLPAEINRIGVAWDGDDEAARAVAAAMPFLSMANMVDVVTVHENSYLDIHPEDIVEYLAWHGIASEAHMLTTNYQTIGARLVEFMEERAWDMIVMGAFGRGRFIERFFSGPTKGVPWRANIPVLQSH